MKNIYNKKIDDNNDELEIKSKKSNENINY